MRCIFRLIIAIVSIGSVPNVSYAKWPEKPVRMIVPASAGGAADTLARSIGKRFSEKFGQPVVVDNRPGAAAIIGMSAIAQAPNDGYTIGMTFSGAMSINPSLYKSLQYDAKKDFAPIALAAVSPLVVAVNPSVGVSSLDEMVQLAKKNPGELTFGSAGTGSTQHLSMELLKSTKGIDMLHVPYKGSAASIVDLQSGRISAVSENAITLLPLIQDKRVIPLAVGTSERIQALPDVPTISELGHPGYLAAGWYGLIAPAGAPEEIIENLNSAMNDLLKDQAFVENLRRQGMEPRSVSAEGFAAFIAQEQEQWARVITEANVPTQD